MMLVELDDEHIKCGICTNKFSTDTNNDDVEYKKISPRLELISALRPLFLPRVYFEGATESCRGEEWKIAKVDQVYELQREDIFLSVRAKVS